MVYRRCIVPSCKNASITARQKIFIQVPLEENRQKLLLEARLNNPEEISTKCVIYVCEDHFNEKLLSKLEESQPELATSPEEECVICIHAKATMQTSPCGHQVVCRKCFVKTIQIAVSQRLLPLRCVICRAKILRLKTGSVLPTSASGYSMTSRGSSVPASDSLYSVSSGGSSISSGSSSSEGATLKDGSHAHGSACCGGHCVGGAYPRQPVTGAIRRSQKQEMKMTLKDYCRPEKNHINRLPPIRESSPLHSVPPASTRIRCAQKIVTQLEMPLLGRTPKGYKYEKLSQEDDDASENSQKTPEKQKRWWSDRTKSEEKIDNKKNEIMEKNMEMKERLNSKSEKKNKEKGKSIMVRDERL